MRIILIGFMGAGKTTVAQELATQYQLTMADTDHLLSQRFQQPAGQLLTTVGESEFRRLEFQVLQDILREQTQVIATGGGIIESPQSLDLLSATPNVFWLDVDFATCWQRIAGDTSRPIAAQTDQATLAECFERRRLSYLKASNTVIQATQKIPEQLAREIYQQQQFPD